METVERAAGPRRPLRLVCLIDSLAGGGAESLLVQWARSLEPRCVDLQVICLKELGGNPFRAELEATGARVRNLQSRNLRDRRAFRTLLSVLRAADPDLVHAHLTDASIWGVVAARLTRTPLVATLHTLPVGGAPWSRERLREWLMCRALNRGAAAVIAVSAAVRDAFVDDRGLDPDRTRVVHNGVEVTGAGPDDDDPGELRRRLGLSDGDLVVLTVAALREGKGHARLLEAAPAILESCPRARFLFVGDGPLAHELRRRSRGLGVDRQCRWAGFRRDLSSLLSAADLLVQPSDAPDALPTATLEGMAAGLPVVATRSGGLPEILQGTGAGRLVPVGDARALAAAIAELLERPGHREAMGRAALHRARAAFSMSRWLRRLEEVYAAALGHPVPFLDGRQEARPRTAGENGELVRLARPTVERRADDG